eukprot:TRINITY_DN552_c1_g2_i1.p1 TRINITY_DN552_c1_g2~~TRINITY_DN552_c1_g2_i1.p1  ORF type:complete len:201 (+),score=11.41 TRINITY_DN552_c1_g2_i1:193-795(+)
MEKRKLRESVNEVALAKAAAWAWYQRGSGSEGKPISEFHLRRTRREPIPSRYKLEEEEDEDRAVDDQVESSEPHSLAVSPTHTDISLLDSYEIERISRQLDCLLESSRRIFSDGSSSPYINGRDHRNFVSSPENSTRRSKMAGKVNGFWLRHAVGICSSRGDEVEASLLGRGTRRTKQNSMARSLGSLTPRALNPYMPSK